MLFYCIFKTIFMEGEQPFEIVMKEAKFNVIVKMDTITGCEVEQNLVITDIALPLDYSAVKFDFTNIGSVLGAKLGSRHATGGGLSSSNHGGGA